MPKHISVLAQDRGEAGLAAAENLPIREHVWKDPIFWFAIALGLADGCVRNFVPTTFPIFSRDMGATLRQMGATQFLFYLSSLIFAVIGGTVLTIIGLRRSAMIALVLVGASLILIGFAHAFIAVLVGSALLGLAIVALVVIISSIVSGHFSTRRQSVFLLSGLSDASGSMVGPAILGWWIVHSELWHLTWRSGYLAAAAVMGMLVVWAFFLPVERPGARLAPANRRNSLGATAEVLGNSAFYTAVVLCFCHGVAQAGMVSFIGQLYLRKLHIDAAHAAYLLSVEAIGILAGRLTFGAISSRWSIPELLLIASCAAVETVAFLATILCKNYLAGAALFLAGGFFMSAIGPSLNSFLGGKLASRAATAFALFAGLGNLGAAAGPYIIGILGSNFGIERGILFAPLFSGLLSFIGFSRYLHERRFPRLLDPVIAEEGS